MKPRALQLPRLALRLAAFAGLGLVGACQTAGTPIPAVLESADDQSLTALRVALAQAVGRANAQLGAGDPSTDPTVAILPPPPGPLETASLARPILFDLILDHGACYAVRRDTGEIVRLDDLRCVPASQPAE